MISSALYMKDYKTMLSFAAAGISAAADEDKDFYFFAGLAALHLEEFEQAAGFLKEYINAHPDDSRAIHYMGLALRGLGDEQSAARVLKAAQEMPQGTGIRDIGKNMISLQIF
jgi:tetratricopeptide (TPR) repeat protein